MAKDLLTTDPQVRRQLSTLGPTPTSRDFSDLLAWHLSAVEEEYGDLVTERVPQGDALDRLTERRDELAAALFNQKNDKREIEVLVSALMTKFMVPKIDDEQAKVIARSYATTLIDLPLWAIRRTFDKIANGRVEGFNLDIRPSAPRLRVTIQNELAAHNEQYGQISRVLRARQKEAIDEEERSKVAEKLKDLAESMRADRKRESSEEDERLETARARLMQRTSDVMISRDQGATTSAGFPITSALRKQLSEAK